MYFITLCIIATIEFFLCAKYCTIHFIYNSLFYPHDNSMNLYCHLQFTDKDTAIENLNNLPKVSEFYINADNVVLTMFQKATFL